MELKQEEKITGSIANISEENFNKGAVRDASTLLQGKGSGLIITSGSGDVTRESQIRLRGYFHFTEWPGTNDCNWLEFRVFDMSTVFTFGYWIYLRIERCFFSLLFTVPVLRGCDPDHTKRGSGSRTQVTYNAYVTMDKV